MSLIFFTYLSCCFGDVVRIHRVVYFEDWVTGANVCNIVCSLYFTSVLATAAAAVPPPPDDDVQLL